MKALFVGQLVPNQVVVSIFLVQHKDVRQKKTGEPYLSMVLADRSGDIEAKMWDNVAEVMDTFERDDFVRVKGVMQIFQGRPQFTIHKMVRVQDQSVDFADYFPSSERDPEQMYAELRDIARGVSNPHLRRLLDAFLDDEQIARGYKTAPAAKNVHHAFLGGLLEHVLSVCKLARMICGHYGNVGVDLDLVLAGAVLHDIGKISELSYQRSFTYTTEGQLLGHIVIALRMLSEKIALVPDFPPQLRTLLEHLIISHHGELEFGSPKVPLFPEAMLLHHLDNLDSKMECMRATIARDRHADGCWTGWSSSLERPVFKKSVWLNGAPAAQSAAAAASSDSMAAAQEPAPTQAEALPLLAWSETAEPTRPPGDPPGPETHSPRQEPRPRPVTGSLFGEKLQEALNKRN
ncbi:MAG TPA: HD domain-containing protein [Bryobacteraceae bacterium]|nr:HD domain-containing protein [Bryobacteraceae bacterium]